MAGLKDVALKATSEFAVDLSAKRRPESTASAAVRWREFPSPFQHPTAGSVPPVAGKAMKRIKLLNLLVLAAEQAKK
jgi:hypothetical protein